MDKNRQHVKHGNTKITEYQSATRTPVVTRVNSSASEENINQFFFSIKKNHFRGDNWQVNFWGYKLETLIIYMYMYVKSDQGCQLSWYLLVSLYFRIYFIMNIIRNIKEIVKNSISKVGSLGYFIAIKYFICRMMQKL